MKKFLKKGFIVGEDTLVERIYKVPGKKYLKINLSTGEIKLKKYKNALSITTHKKITPKIYNDTFEKMCLSSKSEEIATTISSGYDTNYILYNLNKNVNKNINTFCIGGTIGRNEVPDAKQICETYDKVKMHHKLVDGTSLNRYPEIVLALEGAIYESGVFLQYELAKLITSSKINSIILGECADQVLNYELYHPVLAYISKLKYYIKKSPKIFFKNITVKPYKNVYEMASYKILKKNGILMNYFNINTDYPYLRKEFIGIGKKVAKIGDSEKKYHKEVINSLLAEEIVKILKKIGGATELKTLFIGDIKFEKIKSICEKSKFFKPRKFDDEFYEIDYFMKILYIELFEKIFLSENKDILNEKFESYDLFYFFPELKG